MRRTFKKKKINENFLPSCVTEFCTAVSLFPVEPSKWKENFTFMDQ